MYHGQEMITHHCQQPRSQHSQPQPWVMVGNEKPCGTMVNLIPGYDRIPKLLQAA